MFLKWTKDLSTRIIWIDRQHINFFKKMDQFLVATNIGKGHVEAVTALNEIEDYAKYHFATEEKYMLQENYPEYKLHETEHKKYKEKFKGLKDKFMLEGASSDFLRAFQLDIIDWYKNHIKKFDMNLARFLNAN